MVHCVVPHLVGLKLSSAESKIRKAHCSVGTITHKRGSSSKRGKVVGQSPAPGKRLRNHAKVNLTVGK